MLSLASMRRYSHMTTRLNATSCIMSARDELLMSINRQVGEVFARWHIYRELFDADDTVALLNRSGGYVFWLLQRLMLDDALLALSRLTDPPSSGRGKNAQANASIGRLVELALPGLPPLDASAVRDALSRLEGCVANIRVHRSKALAHADLEHATGATKLPDVEYADIESAMQELEGLVLKLGSSTAYRVGGFSNPVFAFGNGTSVLLHRLRCAEDDDTDRG